MNSQPERMFYETESYWDPARYPIAERRRVETAWSWIPATGRVLDAGCGNGIFANMAPSTATAISADRAFAPLRWVEGPRLQADIGQLPFADRSFDAVASLEVLEHLPHEAFSSALDELSRVARRHILVGVPYREDRRAGMVRCPRCQCRFHLHYHMRSFDRPTLERLFESAARPMRLVRLEGIEPVARPIFARGIAWLKLALPRAAFPNHAICAQCGFRNALDTQRASRAEQFLADRRGLVKSLWPARREFKWWLALYEAHPSAVESVGR